MKRSTLVWTAVIAGIALLAFGAVLIAGVLILSEDGGFSGMGSGSRIAVIPVEGVITDETAREINKHLKQYGDDNRVKAILLRVNSPGGGVTASEEIHREVKRIRDEKKKKIVVSMGTAAASGGYFISAPADLIMANRSTITGSIGVIAEWVNYKGLADWAKLKPVVVKSGEFKDIGSPTRDMSPREQAFFQGFINNLYNQFVRVVVDGRKGKKDLDEAKIRALADGRIYSGEQALENGLVDELGAYEDALKRAAELAGIKGEPQTITPPKQRDSITLLDLLFGKTRISGVLPADLPGQLIGVDSAVKFKYQWK
ncbi:MAG: signal peptide peptidase SppA [Blastocatellia bacterium]